ncbi:MAG: hypothetical protein QG602_1970 [Verrucomicrobiota bacterium]|nr:hypothetical protein [Verrucomicrobiota bacterium]
MKPKYVGTKISAEAHKAFRVHAAKDGESASSLLNRLIHSYLARKEAK